MPFGNYLLLKKLATGGLAEIFLARDTVNARFAVIKRILPFLLEEPEFVGMFLDEARIVSMLNHPNIVGLYELGQLKEGLFLAMEWVDGVDLRRLMQKEEQRHNTIPVGMAAFAMARLCEGLHYAHNRTGPDGKPLGLIHRDVSPQNVMVSFNGEVKLVDFGIAKASSWASRSRPGVIKGKFLYLSPEQLAQEKLDHRSDIFSLGSLMYELVTGVQDYPSFLPWCDKAEVLERHEDGITARLGLAYMGVRPAFTTRNLHLPGTSVTVQLVDGPFSLLDGTWFFHPLGRPGSEERACKIEFDLRYAFSSKALETVVSPVFDKVANTFVDSFVRRAEDVYGAR